MQDFSNQSFIYSGQKYTMSITLYTNTSLYTSFHSLNNEDIELFEYTNEANCLYVHGSIIYTDHYGIIDKYMQKQFPYCDVMFVENERKLENGITIENISETNNFTHKFFITSIEILTRQESIIKYKIHLMSINWFNLVGVINYSNYNKRPETLIELIKKAFSLNNLNIDKNTFDKVKTDVKINYITNSNENTITMIKYLLSKLFYYKTKDQALKFIYYNDIKNNYSLFDIMNKETSNATYSLVISMFKTLNESYIQEEPLNLGTITVFPKTDTFNNIFNYNITDYDYQHNKFFDQSIKSSDVIQYLNLHFLDSTTKIKFELIFDTKLHFNHYGTYWNNDNFINIYQNVIKTLFKDNALVINSSGVINRKPGDFMCLNVDRSLKYVLSEEHEDMDTILKKYKNIEGLWIISKVHHLVFPKIHKYRQNISLFRNFIYDDIDKKSK